MTTKKNIIVVHVGIPNTLVEEIDKLARKVMRTRNGFLRKVITDYVVTEIRISKTPTIV